MSTDNIVNSQAETVNPRLTTTVLSELWEDLLNKDDECQGAVSSDSMWPLLKTGDKVRVQKVADIDVCVGDVVVFKRKNRHFSHRVIRIWKENGCKRFLEKGDAALSGSIITGEDIIGKIIARNRHGNETRFDSTRGRVSGRVLAAISSGEMMMWSVMVRIIKVEGQRRSVRLLQYFYSKGFSILRRIVLAAGRC